MNKPHGSVRFWTTPPVTDRVAGSTTIQLHREQSGQESVAAEVVFWDAAGQYFLETFGGDVPLLLIEELIAEAKVLIRYK